MIESKSVCCAIYGQVMIVSYLSIAQELAHGACFAC
jgi:hypothetical protein